MLNFATTDFALAVAHHLLVFALVGVLAYEIGAVRRSMTAGAIRGVGRVDAWYGILAVAIIAIGFTRAVYAAKGWSYYSVNLFFWLKLGTFAVVGLLSIYPTVVFIQWRRALGGDPSFSPPQAAVGLVMRFLWAEAGFFALIPIFAAAMARGYGLPGG